MSLSSQARAELLDALQPHVRAIAEDLRVRVLEPGTPAEASAREAAVRLHREEGSGDDVDVWLDLLGHRAAVLWVLKLVYVRVLEDRGLIRSRIVDPTRQTLFERMAPSLGETAFVRWVFLELAQPVGGLPELFAPQPAEVLPPADVHTRALLALLREVDRDTGVRRFAFEDERFDGQLLGDLYQELDPVVKERFALLQTPDFVREFMLDRTLGEALKEWKADEIRVIDPACGSGHFLIDSLRRLVDATAAQHPDWTRMAVVQSVLGRVVGLDLNDYAAALARARLVMTALELSGEADLASAGVFHPLVFWADGLEQVERGEDSRGTQLVMGEDPARLARAVLTPAATRAVLRPVLEPGFHVVVANPPYIVESDETRKRYHKERIGGGKAPRYKSAVGKYSLGAPFMERLFQLARVDGFVGVINSNAFAKREFGVGVVESVLAQEDIHLVVDTSGAFIPGHGTPTVLLFGRHRKRTSREMVAILGKRGEPTQPADARSGRVWRAICATWSNPEKTNPFVSAERVNAEIFARHPWSLRGGGALALQAQMSGGRQPLEAIVADMGFASFPGMDDAFILPTHSQTAKGIPSRFTRAMISGESIRDWAIRPQEYGVVPYDSNAELVPLKELEGGQGHFWRLKTSVGATMSFGGRTRADNNDPHWSWYRWQAERIRNPLTVSMAFVATHNQFALDRGGKVFNRSAPVIKLAPSATVDGHLAIAAGLNSSAACFWMKQVFFCKGGQGINEGLKSEMWEQFWEHDSTKLARFPLPPDREATIPWARALDALGHARAADTVSATLDLPEWSSPSALRALLAARRERDLQRLRQMVGHQEELDWLVYRLYGLVPPELPVLDVEETPPVTPGHRPFELDLAVRDAATRAALARGETPDDTPTAWFERHGWTPATALPADAPPAWADLVARRRALTAATPHLQLLEAPVHKRRWYKPDFADDEKAGLRTWLLDRIEDALKTWDMPTTPRALARKLATDARFGAAAVVYTGVEAPDLGALCAQLMAGDAVAAHPVHRYTAKGRVKRKAWEHTWALQAAEDRGEPVKKIPVPPSYTGADFVGSVAYPLRGKLDVPKERFVAHTEVPSPDGKRRTGEDALYGWAGWTREERLRRLFALLEDLDDKGVPAPERVALHDLMFRYADELARTEPAKAADLRADLRGEAGAAPTEAQVEAWLRKHPATGAW